MLLLLHRQRKSAVASEIENFSIVLGEGDVGRAERQAPNAILIGRAFDENGFGLVDHVEGPLRRQNVRSVVFGNELGCERFGGRCIQTKLLIASRGLKCAFTKVLLRIFKRRPPIYGRINKRAVEIAICK